MLSNWNLELYVGISMCLTLDAVPMGHKSGSAVLIIWVAYENEGAS
jgi:hypothetical protein